MVEPFDNREQAGRELARALDELRRGGALVLAIPRGGVVVGFEVARSLDLAMDVIVPRKIPAPGQEELAIGAVATWGDHESILDEHAIRMLGVSPEYVARASAEQLVEAKRRLLVYRGKAEPPDVRGRVVVLVDDGIATGYTTRAAAVALRHLGAASITLAVPVGPPDSVAALRPYADSIICLRTPRPFMAVGYWYRDFQQVSDEQVVDLLSRAKAGKPA